MLRPRIQPPSAQLLGAVYRRVASQERRVQRAGRTAEHRVRDDTGLEQGKNAARLVGTQGTPATEDEDGSAVRAIVVAALAILVMQSPPAAIGWPPWLPVERKSNSYGIEHVNLRTTLGEPGTLASRAIPAPFSS